MGLSVLIWLIAVIRARTAVYSGDVLFGIVANSMTLCTIGCFLFNLGYFVWFMNGSHEAFRPPAVNVEGNETTAFFAFAYAFYMISAGTLRNVFTICERAKKGEDV